MTDTSITREERYLEYLTGDRKGNIPQPITRRERYLYELCLKGMGGEISPEEIKNAVNEYLEKNPVKPGATTEQAQQIEQNKTDIASLKTETSSLKEDIDNLSSSKITKFYASSQGETHLADSDNGKIMDMMVYGKSEQKQYSGKNLLNPTLGTTTQNGVTCTNNGDGTYTLNGTATATGIFTLHSNIDFTGQMRLCGGTSLVSLQYSNSSNFAYEDKGAGIIIEHFDSVTYPNASFNILIKINDVYNNALVKPMITTDLTATYDDFEPYTGGIPSPNPDYPQEIKSVVNPTVKVCGKNLIDTGEIKAFRNVTISNGTVKQATADKRTELQWKIMQYDLKNNILETNSSNILQSGTRFGVVFTAKEKVKRIVFGLNGLKIDTTVAISVDLKVGAKYIISCNLLNSTQGSIEWNDMMLEEGTTIAAYEPYHEQTVTLPYTLNAIPVNSGGNVTIDGQQYVADYVDVERGKLVRMVGEVDLGILDWAIRGTSRFSSTSDIKIKKPTSSVKKVNELCTIYRVDTFDNIYGNINDKTIGCAYDSGYVQIYDTAHNDGVSLKQALTGIKLYFELETPEEIDLTEEEIATLKALETYYPTTNISINSEQLDGYTVFNYPISMANGWNYVKKQLNDSRDYIYDMDIQSAEAYVNSEYAVALTELEV